MTLEQIIADGYKVRRIMKRMAVLSNDAHDVYISHRPNDSDEYTRPLMLGRGVSGFIEAIDNLNPV